MIVKLTDYAFRKLSTYVEHATGEVSGFGEVEYFPAKGSEVAQIVGGYFLVTDLDILPQEAGYAHATITPQDYAKYVTEKVKQKKSVRKLRLWWHSHAHMEAFFSGTDTGTIEGSHEFDWLLSMVVNKKGSVEARVDTYTPRVTREITSVLFLPPGRKKWTAKHTEAARKEVDEKVSQRSYLPVPAWKPKWTHIHDGVDPYHREPSDDIPETVEEVLQVMDAHKKDSIYVPRENRIMLYRNGILVPHKRKAARKMAKKLMWKTTQEMTPEEFQNWLIITSLHEEDGIERQMGFIE
jgi:hypothetical protein